MVAYAKQWPDRRWAVRDRMAPVATLRCAWSLMAKRLWRYRRNCWPRAQVFVSGQGGKTDAWDAHSVALVGTRTSGLHPVVDDQQRTLLRILVDRRQALGENHTRMTSQLHVVLLELIPGGAKKDLSGAPGDEAARGRPSS
jgi:transposase